MQQYRLITFIRKSKSGNSVEFTEDVSQLVDNDWQVKSTSTDVTAISDKEYMVAVTVYLER